jgi:hypothetical protein
MMLVWHVENLMESCEDDFELTKLSSYLAKIYGLKLTMHTGRKHDYLGVNMEFRKDGTLGVSMIPYLKNVIPEFPEIISGKSPTSAADHLFKIRDEKDVKPLEEERALAIPSYGCSAFVHGHEGQERHPNCGGLSRHTS